MNFPALQRILVLKGCVGPFYFSESENLFFLRIAHRVRFSILAKMSASHSDVILFNIMTVKRH